MATYTTFYDGQTLASRLAVNADSPAITGVGIMEYIIDFATARFGATGAKATTSDVLDLFPIPKASQITYVSCDVLTAEGGTLTLDLGDETTADLYVNGVNGNSAVSTGYMVAEATWAATFYAAADTIKLTIVTGATIGTAKVRFRVFGIFGNTNV